MFRNSQVAMALGINQMLQSMSYFIAGPVQKHRQPGQFGAPWSEAGGVCMILVSCGCCMGRFEVPFVVAELPVHI